MVESEFDAELEGPAREARPPISEEPLISGPEGDDGPGLSTAAGGPGAGALDPNAGEGEPDPSPNLDQPGRDGADGSSMGASGSAAPASPGATDIDENAEGLGVKSGDRLSGSTVVGDATPTARDGDDHRTQIGSQGSGAVGHNSGTVYQLGELHLPGVQLGSAAHAGESGRWDDVEPMPYRAGVDGGDIEVDSSVVEAATRRAQQQRVICITSAHPRVLDATVQRVARQFAGKAGHPRFVQDVVALIQSDRAHGRSTGARKVLEWAAEEVLVVYIEPDDLEARHGEEIEAFIRSVSRACSQSSARVLIALSPTAGVRLFGGRVAMPCETPIVTVPFLGPLFRGRWGESVAVELIEGFETQRANGRFQDDLEAAERAAEASRSGLEGARRLASAAGADATEGSGDEELRAASRRSVERVVLALTSSMRRLTPHELDKMLKVLLPGTLIPAEPFEQMTSAHVAEEEGDTDPQPLPASMDAWDLWQRDSMTILETLGLRVAKSRDGELRVEFTSARAHARAEALVDPWVQLRCFDQLLARLDQLSARSSSGLGRTLVRGARSLVEQHPDHFDESWTRCKLVSAVRGGGATLDDDEPRTRAEAADALEELWQDHEAVSSRLELIAESLGTQPAARAGLNGMVRGLTGAGRAKAALRLCGAIGTATAFDPVPHLRDIAMEPSEFPVQDEVRAVLIGRCGSGAVVARQVAIDVIGWLDSPQAPEDRRAPQVAAAFVWHFVHSVPVPLGEVGELEEGRTDGNDGVTALARSLGAAFSNSMVVEALRRLLKMDGEGLDADVLKVAGVDMAMQHWEEQIAAEDPGRMFLREVFDALDRELRKRLVARWRRLLVELRDAITDLARVRDGRRGAQDARRQAAELRRRRSRITRLMAECRGAATVKGVE